jgi:hypothetical protein
MNARHIREQIQSYVNQLSPERLPVVLDFLADLVERESNDATKELLEMPGFIDELREAEAEVTTAELADWRTIRNDV